MKEITQQFFSQNKESLYFYPLYSCLDFTYTNSVFFNDLFGASNEKCFSHQIKHLGK